MKLRRRRKPDDPWVEDARRALALIDWQQYCVEIQTATSVEQMADARRRYHERCGREMTDE